MGQYKGCTAKLPNVKPPLQSWNQPDQEYQSSNVALHSEVAKFYCARSALKKIGSSLFQKVSLKYLNEECEDTDTDTFLKKYVDTDRYKIQLLEHVCDFCMWSKNFVKR